MFFQSCDTYFYIFDIIMIRSAEFVPAILDHDIKMQFHPIFRFYNFLFNCFIEVSHFFHKMFTD